MEKMRLSDLGEKEIIRRLGRLLDVGDDAAYLRVGGRYLILSTDMINSKTHILPIMSREQIGKFIVTVNLSDIAAMGAEPFAFLLAYGGPDEEFENFMSIIESANRQCRRYGAEYAGGDTKYMSELTLSGTAVGFTGKPILRSGAKPGDMLSVTGTLGGAALATDFILKGIGCSSRVARKAVEPEPRVNEGILLGNYASAMTDISDSLSMSAYDIAQKSGVGIRLNINRIPVDRGALRLSEKMNVNLTEYALYGGGDYELLFTAPEDKIKTIEEEIEVTRIGEVIKERRVLAADGDREYALERRGYEHFKRT